MRLRAAALVLVLLALPAAQACAGVVGSTLGKYTVAGAGIGALLGTATATIPYMQSKQPYDFTTGAALGMLTGSVVGMILGVVDVANPPEEAALTKPEGFVLAWQTTAVQASWTLSF